MVLCVLAVVRIVIYYASVTALHRYREESAALPASLVETKGSVRCCDCGTRRGLWGWRERAWPSSERMWARHRRRPR